MTGSYKMGKRTGMEIKANSDNQGKSLHFGHARACLVCPLFSPSNPTAYLEK